MNEQDTLGTEISRLARERLLALAEECHIRGRHDLGRNIEEGATSGIEDDYAELIAVAPRLAPVNVDWDWIPNDWVVVACDVDGSYLAFWTAVPEGWSP